MSNMNLENYLKHADGCAYKKTEMDTMCANCKKPRGEHRHFDDACPAGLINDFGQPERWHETDKFYGIDCCTCSLASIQSRLVLLPDGLKEIILEILHDKATSVPVEGGWDNVKGIRADNFNTVAEDIVKAVKGEGR